MAPFAGDHLELIPTFFLKGTGSLVLPVWDELLVFSRSWIALVERFAGAENNISG